jgi:phosphoglycolate phosphatase
MIFTDKKLLIFDFDGTLIDSVPDLADALNKMLIQLNKEPFHESTIRYWVGNGAQTLVKRALVGSDDISDFKEDAYFSNALRIFLEFYKQNCAEKTTLYPNVKTTLEKLKTDGYELAIVTNKPYIFIEPILKKLDLDRLFSLYLGGDSLDEKKPSAKPLLYLCEKLHYNTEDTLMIGDSKNDIIAANNAKMDSIAVSYGYNYGEDIALYSPSIIIQDFNEMETLLGKVNVKK